MGLSCFEGTPLFGGCKGKPTGKRSFFFGWGGCPLLTSDSISTALIPGTWEEAHESWTSEPSGEQRHCDLGPSGAGDHHAGAPDWNAPG